MRHQSIKAAGFTLIPVVLAMSLIAAIAFLLNRDNGINIDMVSGQMDADRARYAAEAGLQAINAKVQSLSCTGGFPISGSPITNSNFGGASYSAYATSASGNTTGLVSTGTYNGTVVTLTRNSVYVYQASANTYTLQPNEVVGTDTFIDSANANNNYGASGTLSVKKNQQNLLLKFDLSGFPAGSRPLSAILDITGSGSWAASFDLYRMTSSWVEGTSANSPLDGATWNTSNGSTAWTLGGTFHSASINKANIIGTGATGVSSNITDLAAAWLSGQYPNNGVVIKSNGELGTVKFVSSDDSTAQDRPKITFNYLVPCGATGPVDPPPISSVTLNPIADGFDDNGAALANNGATSTIKTYYTPTRENRILMQFNTTGIPTGSTILSANLRMYISAVASPTTNTKSIWLNAVNDTWVEGSGNNTNKVCPTVTAGSSWNYKTGCTNWVSNIHPPYSPQAYTNNAAMNMPTARTNHMVATVNNKIYTIGGFNPVGGYFNKVEEYDPATNTWVTKANMPTARADAAVAVVNGKIYVIGGKNSGSFALNVNEVFDPIANTWATKKVMTTGRMFFSGAVVNNKIYAIGGTTTVFPIVIPLSTNEVYDPSTDTWATKANMPTARIYFSAQSVNAKIYTIGGYSGVFSLTNNEVYDPNTNLWAIKATLPVATDSMASAVLGNKIYLFAGMRGNSTTNAVTMYDTVNNAYSAQLNYPIAANSPEAVALNGYIYSIGGDDGISMVYATQYRFNSGIPTPVAMAIDETTSESPLAAGFTSGWINFDVKPLTQEWVDGVRPNNGLVLYTEVADQFNINSRENSAKNPQLIVTYQ